MTDAEIIEIMVDGVILHLGVPISKDDPDREYYRGTLGAAYAALTEAGLAIVDTDEFKTLLRVVDAEWMVTPDWCEPGGRAPIIEPAYKVLEKHKAMIGAGK